MSFDFYKVMHFLGIFMVFSALGGQIVQSMNGRDAKQMPGRKWMAIFHGVGLLLVLIAGFGMIAKANVGFPGWVLGKIGIWIALGGIGAIVARKKSLAGLIWVVVIMLGFMSAYLGHYKP